jgi:hypothetical protein
MRIRGCLLAAIVAVLAMPAAASAADVTLGTTTQPTSSTGKPCPTSPGQVLIESSGGLISGPLSVPSSVGPLAVTQWQVDASGATAGAQLELVVLRVNVAAETITVVGTDTETLNPAGLPPDGVQTFNLSKSIPVDADDLIGAYAPGSTSPGIDCYWSGGSTADVTGFVAPTSPTAGSQLTPEAGGVSSSNSILNLSATLAPVSYDAGVSLSSGPSNAVVGQPAVLTAVLANHGPQTGPMTFTDPVPGNLTVEYASVGDGTCGVNAVNIVTCYTADAAPGASTAVVIVVTPTTAQTYKDSGTVSLTGGGTDPNPANNSATTTLKVSKAGAPTKCAVPKLGGVSESVAKKLLPLLGCKVGKVKKATSKKVPKGDVISTSPGAGSYAVGKSIAMTESSGKPKKKKKK